MTKGFGAPPAPPAPARAPGAIGRQASALGVSVAGGSLGKMHWNGVGGDEDRARAVEIWREAAAMGDPHSNRELAWVAELGRDGSPADPELSLCHCAIAVRLFEQFGLEEDAVDPRYRRATLARLLEPEMVAGKWREAMAFEPAVRQ